MQPYLNPNYFGYNNYLTNYPNANNGYMPNQSMPNQNVSSPIGLSGRCVNSFDEINVNEIVMDGRPSIFVKNDRSEIQVKNWDANGRVITTSYLPQIEEKSIEVDKLSTEVQKSKFDTKTEVLEPIFERLEQLENKIDKLSRTNSTSKTKKEVSDE